MNIMDFDFEQIKEIYDVIVAVADYISTLLNDIDYSAILDIFSNITTMISNLM